MQTECISLSVDDEVTLFWYEPTDITPTTHVFGRSECGVGCGPGLDMSFVFLANSVADIETVFSAFRHGAKDAATGEDEVAYADRQMQAFFDRLHELEAEDNGSLANVPGDVITKLLGELDEHAYLATPGMAVTNTGLEGHGMIVDYLADDWNQKLALGMLKLYCEDTCWQDALGPEPAVVCSQIEGKKALVIPGDEALVALAINLYNKGAYDEWSIGAEEEEE